MPQNPYTPSTLEEILWEARRAINNDDREKNVTIDNFGYTVSEETRRFGSNHSIQSAGSKVFLDSREDVVQASILSSTQGNLEHRITAYSTGALRYSVYKNGEEISWLPLDSETASHPLTDAEAIRNLQLSITSDGEVDRAEQQQIINLVQQAREYIDRGR